MWIKICANTNAQDARLAAELGADAVGFVFAESARQVTAEQVAAIVPLLPDSVEKIGVFSTRDFQEIAGIVRKTGLTGIQLHGGFDLELARRLHSEFGGSIAIIQVLHWAVASGWGSASEIAAQLQTIAEEKAVQRVLIDSKTSTSAGGTGESFDWAAASARIDEAHRTRVIVAGGLHPGNIRRAIKELNPWGVDVASGVEARKGRKDPEKLRQFIEFARVFQEGVTPGPAEASSRT